MDFGNIIVFKLKEQSRFECYMIFSSRNGGYSLILVPA